jgi:hypothetical protein
MTDAEPGLPDLRRTRAERAASAVPAAFAAVWAAAEALNLAHVPAATPVAIGTAVAASLSFGASGRSDRVAPWVAWAIAGTGGWLSGAVAWGPVSSWPLSAAWAAAATYAAWKARRHPAVAGAREWREARADWLVTCREWGLHGSHLLAHEWTRAGQEWTVDVSGTGKLASAITRSALAEHIATRRRVPKSRVTVSEGVIAGQLRISVRDRDPWAHPIPHPATAGGHEVELPDRPSITDPLPVGQDPATGRLLSLLLCGPGGGRNISVVATLEGGKTTLLACVSERVTACPDALMIRVNVSVKGPAEEHLWGPACHLTAFGPSQAGRALKILRVLARVIEWRAGRPKTTANWRPSPRNPHIVLIVDEIDAAMKIAALRHALEPLATKGREYGVTIVRAGQRGTADYTGGSNIRAVDGVWCLGALNRSTEAMHAAGELGLRLPDVASYGEGHPGVWVIAEQGSWMGGRAWNLSEPADIAGIARASAASQPELPPECAAFLGEEYAQLLGTDVYARWAHGQAASAPPEAAPAAVQPQPGAQAWPVPAATVTATDEIDQLDWCMDDRTQARFRALDEKLGRTRGILAETQALPPGPDVPEQKLKESSEERWRQVGEQAELSPEHREILLGLLKDGTTIAGAVKALGVSTWTARGYLQKLRNEGRARIDGKGRGARWRLAGDSGNAQ